MVALWCSMACSTPFRVAHPESKGSKYVAPSLRSLITCKDFFKVLKLPWNHHKLTFFRNDQTGSWAYPEIGNTNFKAHCVPFNSG